MKKIGILVISSLMMASTCLYSQQPENMEANRILKKLNLTGEQKKDANKVKVDLDKQLITQKAKIETARLELQQLFKADNPDKSAIEKKLNEIADLEVQSQMLKIDSWFQINSLLTPDQQKIWKKALSVGPAMKHKMMERKEHKKMMKEPEEKGMK